jgi:hypothetical protein
MSKLVNIQTLSEMSGLPVRTWRTLIQKRVVPFIKLGHRTLLFQPDKVLKALEKFEVKGT